MPAGHYAGLWDSGEKIVVEKLSGKDFNRPRHRQLVRALRPEDVLVVKSIDRASGVEGKTNDAARSCGRLWNTEIHLL